MCVKRKKITFVGLDELISSYHTFSENIVTNTGSLVVFVMSRKYVKVEVIWKNKIRDKRRERMEGMKTMIYHKRTLSVLCLPRVSTFT